MDYCSIVTRDINTLHNLILSLPASIISPLLCLGVAIVGIMLLWRISLAISKEEALQHHLSFSFEQAREIIDEYVRFYNYERIQLKTRQTPYQTRCLSM